LTYKQYGEKLIAMPKSEESLSYTEFDSDNRLDDCALVDAVLKVTIVNEVF
jgi:hypothetical protein